MRQSTDGRFRRTLHLLFLFQGAIPQRVLSVEDFDFVKAWNDALIKKAMNETSLDSIAARLPPEGQAWLNGLNRFCRRAVEYDLRNAGPDQFLEHWKTLRDTLEKLEREFGPSDEWK